MIENDDRNFREPQFSRGEKTTVTGNDARFRIYEDRIVEAELRDAGSDLSNLCVGVGSRIPSVRDQLVEQPHLNVPRHRMRFEIDPIAVFSRHCERVGSIIKTHI